MESQPAAAATIAKPEAEEDVQERKENLAVEDVSQTPAQQMQVLQHVTRFRDTSTAGQPGTNKEEIKESVEEGAAIAGNEQTKQRKPRKQNPGSIQKQPRKTVLLGEERVKQLAEENRRIKERFAKLREKRLAANNVVQRGQQLGKRPRQETDGNTKVEKETGDTSQRAKKE